MAHAHAHAAARHRRLPLPGIVPARVLEALVPVLNWPAALALMVVGVVLPNPSNVIAFLSSLGLGAGIGAGIGYAAWKSRKTAQDIADYKLWDEAHRGSTIAQLQSQQARNAELIGRIEYLSRELDSLQADFARERSISEDYRRDLHEFAVNMLRSKDISWLAPEGLPAPPMRQDAPAPAPAPAPASRP